MNKLEAGFKKYDESYQQFKKTEQFLGDYLQAAALGKEHLETCGDDLILLTLKGHLLIEHWLELILCRLLSIDALPREGNDKLEFNQKLKLVQAAIVSRKTGPNADLFCVIAKLNSVRNRLAHSLRSREELEVAVKSIIASYQSKADQKLTVNESLATELRDCLRCLCQFLFDVRKHLYKLELDETK